MVPVNVHDSGRLFVVIRERASAWDWSLPMRRQRAWPEHAAFMDELAENGTIVAGGPLGSEDGAARVLHIMTGSVSDLEATLAKDPWTPLGLLRTVSMEPWTVLVGNLPGGTKGSAAPVDK